MGGALLKRWQAQRICTGIEIVDPAAAKMKSVTDIPATFKPNVIVFAVKPQALAQTVQEYKHYTGVLFLSVAAGKPLAFFEKHLGAAAKIVRCMPNTPAAVGKAITVACANKNVTGAERDMAAKLMSAIGDVVWVEKESLLNPVTALSGSGPAYVFLLIETLTKAGVHIGLDPALAERLARQTVIGSAALAEADTSPAAQLRQNVTSPGGTTEAALKTLMAHPGIQELFNRALKDAAQRAEELSV
jgi:pyrroline-5-carboxylate reductase